MNVTPHDAPPLQPLPARVLAEWPVGTWLENIATLSDGRLVVSIHSSQEIQLVALDGTISPLAKLSLPVAGLAVVDCAIYAVGGIPGHQGGQVWRIDPANGKVESWVPLTNALFPNGCTPFLADCLLVADSIRGEIVLVNLRTRLAEEWIIHDLLGKCTGEPMIPGANGIKVFGDHVYVTNTDRAILVRIPILAGGQAGTPEIVAERLRGDDFAFDLEGNLYITTHLHSTVIRLSPKGERLAIAGPEQHMAGCTALAFGRTEQDRTALYVSTTGGLLHLHESDVTETPKIVRVEVGVAGHPIDYVPAPRLKKDSGA